MDETVIKLLTITHEAHVVPRSGAVDSSHAGLFEVRGPSPEPWAFAEVARLAECYWTYLTAYFKRLLRVRHGQAGAATVCMLGVIPLLRLGPRRSAANPMPGRSAGRNWTKEAR